jgi:hypothetical protein
MTKSVNSFNKDGRRIIRGGALLPSPRLTSNLKNVFLRLHRIIR